jgi:hypothetical protein
MMILLARNVACAYFLAEARPGTLDAFRYWERRVIPDTTKGARSSRARTYVPWLGECESSLCLRPVSERRARERCAVGAALLALALAIRPAAAAGERGSEGRLGV